MIDFRPPCWSMVAFGVLLAGCGSDGNKAPQPEPSPPSQSSDLRPFEHVFGALPNHTMAGQSVHFYWNEREHNDGGVGVIPPQSQPIVIRGDEVIRWLDENHGGESVRNGYIKTYKPGNFSSFDIFLYAVKNRQDEICDRWGKEAGCELKIDYHWDEQRLTFEFSINGETNWLFAQDYHGGIEHEQGNWGLEITEHQRPDQVLAKDGLSVGVAPYDQQKVDFFKEVQRQEIVRLNRNDGKMIVDVLDIFGLYKIPVDVEVLGMVEQYITGYVDGEGNPGMMPLAPGSIWLTPTFSPNIEDALLDENGKPKSAWGYVTEAGFIDCGITGLNCVFHNEATTLTNVEVTAHNIRSDYYYDGVITMADVALSLNDHADANGNKIYSGSLVYWPTWDTGAKIETYAIDSINGLGSSGFYGWNYGWDHLMAQASPEMDIGGGPSPHIVGDMAMLTSPDYIQFFYGNMYEQYYAVQKNIVGDEADPYRHTRINVVNPNFPLPETHFGRGVADCGMCHSPADMGFSAGNLAHNGEVQPALCAECHGSNGAPEGHNKVAGCYRCHQDMVGHGDANTANKTVHPFEKTGSGMSRVMPDPYACVSCHINEAPAVVGGL